MISQVFCSILAILGHLYLHLLHLPCNLFNKLMSILLPSWRQPPGPLANWLPFCGSLPLFAFDPSYKVLTRMAKKYGNIFRLKLGSTTLVVIGDPELLRKTFDGYDVSGRRMPSVMDVMNRQGIIYAEGDLMLNQRLFVDKVLLSMSFRNDALQKVLLARASNAITEFLVELNGTGGEPVAIGTMLRFTITNILFSTLVGRVFSREDQELASLIHYTSESFRNTEIFSFANFLPILARLPSYQKAQRVHLKRNDAFVNYMRPIVDAHLQELNAENPKDLIDAFLVEMTRPEAQRNKFFTEYQLYAVLGEIFSASLETISASIHWLLLAIAKHPHIQEYIHDDLNGLVNSLDMPSLIQREDLPYVEATIFEGLRFASILPMGVAHRAVRDTIIQGYHIPKDAMIVGLLWKIHRDPELWKHDPNKFNPTNHLNDRGVLKQSPNFMAFSSGMRSCLGDHVALTLIFLILANTLHKFRIQTEDGTELPSLDDSLDGMLREPLPFKLRFLCR